MSVLLTPGFVGREKGEAALSGEENWGGLLGEGAGFGDELSVRQRSKDACAHVHVPVCPDSVAVVVRGTSVDYLAEEVRFGQGVKECLLSWWEPSTGRSPLKCDGTGAWTSSQEHSFHCL